MVNPKQGVHNGIRGIRTQCGKLQHSFPPLAAAPSLHSRPSALSRPSTDLPSAHP
jgi:hypothetical protein